MNIMLPDVSREFLNRMIDGKTVTNVKTWAGGEDFSYTFGRGAQVKVNLILLLAAMKTASPMKFVIDARFYTVVSDEGKIGCLMGSPVI